MSRPIPKEGGSAIVARIERRKILDRCLPDPFGMARHETLAEYWAARQAAATWAA